MRRFRQEYRAVWSAVLYFTRLPVPAPAAYDPEDLRRAAAYWPLIGGLTGLLVAGVFMGSCHFLPAGLAAALGLLAGILLTGAMHEDGLADVCDGLGGGAGKERALEIMKDSCIGAFGGIALVISLLIRWQTLALLPLVSVLPLILAAHVSSRAAAVSLMATQSYVRVGASKARPLANPMGFGRFALVVFLGLLPLVFLPLHFWPCMIAPLLARFAMGVWFMKRLGGYTGDCLGAVQQVAEIAFLIMGVALI